MAMNGSAQLRYGIICALEELDQAYPVTLRGDIQSMTGAAAKAGFEAIELHIRDPLQYDGEALKEAARSKGLSFAAISTGLEYMLNGLSLISDDEGVRAGALQRLKEHVDLAERIECPTVIIGSMRGNIPEAGADGFDGESPLSRHEVTNDPLLSRQMARQDIYDLYVGRLADAVRELCDYAEGRGVSVCVEAINRKWTNYLCSVPETLRFVEQVGCPNFRIHIDTYQMSMEGEDLGAATALCAGRLGHVHFSDDNRRLPGEGGIDFLLVLKALQEIGYSGYIVFETVGYPPGDSGTQAIQESLEALLVNKPSANVSDQVEP